MCSLKNIAIWLPVLFIFIGTQNALSQDVKARLKSHYSTKVCGTAKEKEYLITVGVGEVKKTDSLYTFDVLLRFNSDDITFEGPVYMNTLVENIFYRKVSIGHEPNTIRAFAFSDDPFVGNKELIGFIGKVKSDCEKPIELIIEEIEFNDDYKKSYSYDSSFTFTPVRIVDQNKRVVVNSDTDTVHFEMDDRNKSVNISAGINPYTGLDELFFDIVLNDEANKTIIKSIESISDDVSVDYINELTKNHYEVKLNIFEEINGKEILKVNFEDENKTDEVLMKTLKVSIRDFGNCHCYSEFVEKDITLVSKSDTVEVSVDDKFDVLDIMYRDSKIFVSNKSRKFIKSIEMYDLLGNRMLIKDLNVSSDVEFPINGYLNNGLYLMILSTDRENISKSIIIYN